MSRKQRRTKAKKPMAHGAIEKEMRSLHEKGVHVERQRNLIRSLLHAIVFAAGGEVVIQQSDIESAGGGKSDINQLDDGTIAVTFVPREDVELPPVEPGTLVTRRRSFWQRLVYLFRGR